MSGEGMSGFVSAAGEQINSTTMWTEATAAVPLIGGIIVFALGFYIVRKVLKGASKGKFKM